MTLVRSVIMIIVVQVMWASFSSIDTETLKTKKLGTVQRPQPTQIDRQIYEGYLYIDRNYLKIVSKGYLQIYQNHDQFQKKEQLQ